MSTCQTVFLAAVLLVVATVFAVLTVEVFGRG